MWKQMQTAPGEPADWLGDGRRLVERLGSAHGLLAPGAVSASLRLEPVVDLPSLRRFLQEYHRQLLVPVELPAIERAFNHACRHELRELAALDRQLAADAAWQPFAEASRRVGQRELGRMRPLRDERMVRRYLDLVASGDADAWHTVIYGLVLALYSIPLRQGLLAYGFQTTHGFFTSAAADLPLAKDEAARLMTELCAPLPAAVEALLARRAAA
jgi:urease accessory protein UreF